MTTWCVRLRTVRRFRVRLMLRNADAGLQHTSRWWVRATFACVRTPVTTHFDRTLNLNTHRVRKFERVKVRKTEHRSTLNVRRQIALLRSGESIQAGPIFVAAHFLKLTQHRFAQHATILVGERNRRTLAIVRKTALHSHVELIRSIGYSDHDRHLLTDRNDTAHLTGPRTFALLNFHPTINVVSLQEQI